MGNHKSVGRQQLLQKMVNLAINYIKKFIQSICKYNTAEISLYTLKYKYQLLTICFIKSLHFTNVKGN